MPNPTMPEWARDFYTESKRYKIAHGGRGSSKSWTFCTMVIDAASKSKKRVLCCREIMTTLKASVRQLLIDIIERYDYPGWRYSERQLTNVNGSVITFAGLKNNPENVKSTEGVDICFIEEGQTISETSMRLLIPTIRKPGSEIWVAMNPRFADDYCYRRFVVGNEGVDNVLSRQVNYTDNPWFNDTMRGEMEYDKQHDYGMYRHIWLGELRPYGERPVFTPDALEIGVPAWASDGPSIYGLDLSWSGKNALDGIQVSEDRRELYVSEAAESSKVPLTELGAWIGELDIAMVVDNARPEVIDMLRKQGFTVRRSKKGAGSVLSGADKMARFHKIWIRPGLEFVADELSRLGWDENENIIGDRDHFDAIRYGLERINAMRLISFGELQRAS